jgi:hypothetical protein
MISTFAGIDKYTFYLDFKGVLSSTPQVFAPESARKLVDLFSDYRK